MARNYLNQIKRNRKGHINKNATVADAIRYCISAYGRFTAYDVQAVINNLLPESEKLSLKDVQRRLSKAADLGFVLEKTRNYYHQRGWPS